MLAPAYPRLCQLLPRLRPIHQSLHWLARTVFISSKALKADPALFKVAEGKLVLAL